MGTTSSSASIADIRRAVYDAGVVERTDGTLLKIVPHTPHPADSDSLRDLVRERKPKRTIEIGCATGLSTLAIFEGLAAEGLPESHTAVDPFINGHFWGGAAVLLMRQARIFDRVTVDERDSAIALGAMLDRGEPAEFAFIDGCHWFECALMDMVFLARIVNPGGTIVVDDPWMPAVATAIDYVTKHLNVCRDSTIVRNGKPRLAVLRVLEQDRERPWDHFDWR